MRFAPVFAVLTALATPVLAEELPRFVSVTGEGSVLVTPDMATISVGVETQGETAGAALRANSEAMAKVIAVLKGAGIDEKDIQTQAINLNPVWDQNLTNEQGGSVISGYAASNIVGIRVVELAKLGDVLDKVSAAGANTFNGISFGLVDPKPATDEARKAAVADARARAQLYVNAAGVKLGPVISISESPVSFGGPVPGAMLRMEADSMAVPVASGEMNVTAQVGVVFGVE